MAMNCPNCGVRAARIIIRSGGSYCDNCSRISSTGGARISGILTRNSDRIRSQQDKHRGDVVIPHTFDKTRGKVVPNPDFVKLYPEQTRTYFSEQDVKESGDKRLVDLWNKQDEDKKMHDASLDKLTHGVKDTKGDADKKAKFIEGL